MNVIDLFDVHKTYTIGDMNIPVLRGVTASIIKGEYVALMGSSGSGKSTLMNIIGCLDRLNSGRYLFEGKDISLVSNNQRAHIRNQKIGFVFQSFNLLRKTSALENVIMPLTYAATAISDGEAQTRAKDLLARVGLESRMDHEPSQLSGGQQQRVAIARALINRPSVLLADEPTGNLDSKTTEEVLSLFKELHEKEGLTIILVTHESDVARNTQRTIRLHDGRVVAS